MLEKRLDQNDEEKIFASPKTFVNVFSIKLVAFTIEVKLKFAKELVDKLDTAV